MLKHKGNVRLKPVAQTARPVRVALAAIFVGMAGWGWCAQTPVRAALSQPPAAATPATTRTAGMSTEPPDNFDPSQFGSITTATLPLADGRKVVGRANGKPIFWEDFTLHARLMGARLYARHPDKEAGIQAVLAGPVMETLFLQSLYNQYATSQSLVVQPAEKQRRRDEFLRSPDKAELAVFASLSGAQSDQLITEALVREKVNKYLGDRATSTPPTLEESAAFARQGTATTSPITITRASHIVVRATADMSQFNINDAEARAAEALEKIRAGMDFADAVKQYSQDRFTAYQGGNLGYFKAGGMYPEFEKAAAALQPGEVSPVVRTPVGFHIIKVTERHADDTLFLLEKWKRQKAVDDWKARMAAEATLENYLVTP